MVINEFTGEYRWLSNFWVLPRPILFAGCSFASTEHLYQACKTTNREEFERIASAKTPGESRRIGKKEIVCRSDWDKIKESVMDISLRLKFEIPELREKLLATGDAELIEGNYWQDFFWGKDLKTGEGKNHLGNMLMLLRGQYQYEEEQKNVSIFILDDSEERIEHFSRAFVGKEFHWAKKVKDALDKLRNNEYNLIFLDHDLGGEYTCGTDGDGIDVAKVMAAEKLQQDAEIWLHSCNSVGRQNMYNTLSSTHAKLHLCPFHNLPFLD